jgi:hypothetical protein
MNSETPQKHKDGLSWYKSLTLNQRFALKELTVSICGLRWEDLSLLFSPRERIELIYQKLKIEGFQI